jgi:tRNA(Ile)-lysidine synthase
MPKFANKLTESLYAIIYFTMSNQVAIILQQDCQVDKKDRLLLGVSGGPDSLYLLHLLHQAGYQVIAAHFNHKLRPEAEQDAELVERFAKNLDIPFLYEEGDVLTLAREHAVSVEEAARQLRYRFLFERARIESAAAVLVAHTADDQVETILMHLLRGSGLAGLTGMEYRTLPNPWSNTIPLIRPLLSTTRADISLYLQKHGIVPALDLSNLDSVYLRNRIRLELLPTLERYNPQIREDLSRMGHILREDYVVLLSLVDTAWNDCLVNQGRSYLSFQRSGYITLPIAVQRYFLRRAVANHLPGLVDVGFDAIERGRRFILEDRTNGRVDLLSGLCLFHEGETFSLAFDQADLPTTGYPALDPGQVIPVTIPSEITLKGGWVMKAELSSKANSEKKQKPANADPYHAWLDAGSNMGPLVLRCRRPGDRIRPLGQEGHSMKLSDLMINLKLPMRARGTWPLVCSGDEVIWVPGYRLSELGRVGEGSTVVVHLALVRDRFS